MIPRKSTTNETDPRVPPIHQCAARSARTRALAQCHARAGGSEALAGQLLSGESDGKAEEGNALWLNIVFASN